MKKTLILAAVALAMASACKKAEDQPAVAETFSCDMSSNQIGENGTKFAVTDSDWEADTSNGYTHIADFKDSSNVLCTVTLQFNHVPKAGETFTVSNSNDYVAGFSTDQKLALVTSRLHAKAHYVKNSGAKIKVMASGDSLDFCYNSLTMTRQLSTEQSTISGHYFSPNW